MLVRSIWLLLRQLCDNHFAPSRCPARFCFTSLEFCFIGLASSIYVAQSALVFGMWYKSYSIVRRFPKGSSILDSKLAIFDTSKITLERKLSVFSFAAFLPGPCRQKLMVICVIIIKEWTRDSIDDRLVIELVAMEGNTLRTTETKSWDVFEMDHGNNFGYFACFNPPSIDSVTTTDLKHY